MLIQTNAIGLVLVDVDTIPELLDIDILKRLNSDFTCGFISRSSYKFFDWATVFPSTGSVSNDILSALTMAGTAPSNTVYVTGVLDNCRLANRSGLGSILLIKDDPDEWSYLPDVVVNDVEDLYRVLNGTFAGYFGEMVASNTNGTGILWTATAEHLLTPGLCFDVMITGRYFTKGDRRSYIHPLTRRLLDAKDYDRQNRIFGRLLNECINVLSGSNTINSITRIPPKPGKADRLNEIINIATQNLPTVENNSDGIVLNRPYPPQKEAGGPLQRALNVKDVFGYTRHFNGNVVLVDDIITSGQTATEAARTILQAGASKVTILAFGASQTELVYPYITVPCEKVNCPGHFVMRFNSRDGSSFYGCTEFRNGCRTNKGTGDIRVRVNELFVPTPFTFDDIEF